MKSRIGGHGKSIYKAFIKQGDARDLSFIASETAHLVCTSPPYGNLITYPETSGQLGNIASYEVFPRRIGQGLG